MADLGFLLNLFEVRSKRFIWGMLRTRVCIICMATTEVSSTETAILGAARTKQNDI
ncbi:hypothetical protein Ccrd_007118, partial [Cynara cardunculus var. scolymus]